MKYLVDHLSRNCVPQGAIEVRTVDDSLSHEAEVVIVDFPRTSGIGFLDERRRVNVASTRANYCTIYVGKVKTLSRSQLLNSLISLHRDSFALLTLPERPKFCDKCFDIGHFSRDCQKKPSCKACNRRKGNHSGRTCRQPSSVASFDMSINIPALDDVDRDILSKTTVVEPEDHSVRVPIVNHSSTKFLQEFRDRVAQ